ncbi:hypothetical protein L5515_018625 [Caenorhabditis briggsae]|uniref:Elongin-C n=2 Tax=Caenorhabditis briggsae TaxID=6238 RepID=A0AAE9FHP0_CAEBR|nr:hypothetical protein L5515_018625 [Caenorhabditis briggsae]
MSSREQNADREIIHRMETLSMENEEIEKLKETSEAPARMDGSEKGDGIEESDSSRVYCDHSEDAQDNNNKNSERSNDEEEEEGEELDEREEGEPSAPPQTCKKKIVYPGLNGNNSVYVKLVSRENDEFVIRRSRAEKSKTIRDMLQGPNAGTDNTVYLHMVSSKCVKALCCYLNWQYEYLKKKGEYEAFYIAPEDSMDLFFMSAYLEL